jgi:hypothetical protein
MLLKEEAELLTPCPELNGDRGETPYGRAIIGKVEKSERRVLGALVSIISINLFQCDFEQAF